MPDLDAMRRAELRQQAHDLRQQITIKQDLLMSMKSRDKVRRAAIKSDIEANEKLADFLQAEADRSPPPEIDMTIPTNPEALALMQEAENWIKAAEDMERRSNFTAAQRKRDVATLFVMRAKYIAFENSFRHHDATYA